MIPNMTKPSLIEKEFAKHDTTAPRIYKNKKSTKKKVIKNMPAPKSEPTGLKKVKTILEDRIAINAMQDMLDRPNLPAKKPAETPVRKPTAPAIPNPLAAMAQNPEVMQNMDPNQLMQISMMSNPTTAMMYMLMQGMGGKQKTTEDVGNLKDLAEIMAVLKGTNDNSGGKDEFTKMLLVEMLKNNRSQPESGKQVMDMMTLLQSQMQRTVEFWQNRALQAEQTSNVDPITSLLESKDKLINLQGLFGGGTPEDMELRQRKFDAELMMTRRQWDMQEKEQDRVFEAQKSDKQLDLITRGLAAMTDYIVKPTMEAVKGGIMNNPNAFEKIRSPSPALPLREDLVPSKDAQLPAMREDKLPEAPVNPFLAPLPSIPNPNTPTPQPTDEIPSSNIFDFTSDHIVPRPSPKQSVKLP